MPVIHLPAFHTATDTLGFPQDVSMVRWYAHSEPLARREEASSLILSNSAPFPGPTHPWNLAFLRTALPDLSSKSFKVYASGMLRAKVLMEGSAPA